MILMRRTCQHRAHKLDRVPLLRSAASQKRDGNGAQKVSRQPQAENTKFSPSPALELTPDESAALVKRLLRDVQGLKSPDAAFAWACQAIGAKNSLASADARLRR